MAQRTHEFVLPSGVPCVTRSLIGEDYDILTSPKYTKNGTQFVQLCKAALLKLGDSEKISEEMIFKLLTNDRKFMLLQIRQHTMRFSNEFKFTWEWPLKDKQKDRQSYEVIFSREQFPVTPYRWVAEAMKQQGKEVLSAQQVEQNVNQARPVDSPNLFDATADEAAMAAEPRAVYSDPDQDAFPEVYSSYAEMLEDQSERKFDFEDEPTLYWRLLNGRMEKAQMSQQNTSVNQVIDMRQAHHKIEIKGTGLTEKSFNSGKADAYMLDILRGEIMQTEGLIDTFLVIENQKDKTQQTRVDLVSVDSFFFPSMAQY